MFLSFLAIHRFVQSWSVRNNGEEIWPYGCYIKSTSNENLPVVPVASIEPGQCTVISVNLQSPSELGSFQTKWRLFTSNGSCFGGMPFFILLSYIVTIAFWLSAFQRHRWQFRRHYSFAHKKTELNNPITIVCEWRFKVT